jgi:hypothetical protein
MVALEEYSLELAELQKSTLVSFWQDKEGLGVDEENPTFLVNNESEKSKKRTPGLLSSRRSFSIPRTIHIPTQNEFRAATLNRRCLFFNEDLKGKTAEIIPKSPASALSPKVSAMGAINSDSPTCFSPMSASSIISNLSSLHGEELSEMDMSLLYEELMDEIEYEQTCEILSLYNDVSEPDSLRTVLPWRTNRL